MCSSPTSGRTTVQPSPSACLARWTCRTTPVVPLSSEFCLSSATGKASRGSVGTRRIRLGYLVSGISLGLVESGQLLPSTKVQPQVPVALRLAQQMSTCVRDFSCPICGPVMFLYQNLWLFQGITTWPENEFCFSKCPRLVIRINGQGRRGRHKIKRLIFV